MLEIGGILLTEEQIQEKVKELAKQVEKEFEGEELYVVGILKGACIFVSDLIRYIDLDVKIDFMSLSSYGMSLESSGVVKIIKDLDMDVEDKNVLIVEDIIDTGLTIDYLKNYLYARKCKKLKICTLLDKPEGRKCDVKADFTGFHLPDEFIIGYGIDCQESYRNLPYIAFVNQDK